MGEEVLLVGMQAVDVPPSAMVFRMGHSWSESHSLVFKKY